MKKFGTVKELMDKRYDELVRRRFEASIEYQKTAMKYGDKDGRTLHAYDQYLTIANEVDKLKGRP